MAPWKKMCNYIFNYNMVKDVNALWLVIIVNLDKNEKEKCVHTVVSNEKWQFTCFCDG